MNEKLTVRLRYFRAHQVLWVILFAIQFLPDRTNKDALTPVLLWVAVFAEIFVLLLPLRFKTREGMQLFVDVMCVIFVVLIAWTFATAKLNLMNEALFPTPGQVFSQMAADYRKIFVNIGSSLGIIVQGFAVGCVCAVPLGLFFGESRRYGKAAGYLAGFLGCIPPVVYIPYGIALLPTFRSVSVFVIFLATFWPVLASTMSGVAQVESRIIDSARVLNVSRPVMLFRIVLPASLPSIFNGMNIGLTISFILLTSAEMIGARAGMGYYVKYYSDFGDFTRIVVGVIVIGVVITAIMYGFGRLQRYLLRWKR
ncbi:MAG: ABC transporter permease subunit [Clostridiales Family XIII bacterium]|nr:ABC transporter permease subunit [Clostridiales Family XIII bacterium]